MSHALKSQNSTIAYGGAGPVDTSIAGLTAALAVTGEGAPSFVIVEEATDIKPSGQKVDEIDVTHLLSAAKEFLMGLEDSGSIDITGNFTGGTGQQNLLTQKASKALGLYQYTLGAQLTTPITVTFAAYVVKFETPDSKVNGKLDLSATLRISGQILISWGSLVTPGF